MNICKKVVHYTLIIMFLTFLTYSENLYSAFEDIPRGAYSLGLAGAVRSIGGAAATAYYNPALIPYLRNTLTIEGSTRNLYGLSDLRENFGAAALSFSAVGFGFSYISTSLSGIYSERTLAAAAGVKTYKSLNLGVSYFQRTISAGRYTANAKEVNLFFNIHSNKINFYTALLNALASEFKLIKIAEKRPRKLSAGIAITPNPRITISLNAEDLTTPLTSFRFATQYKIGYLFIRAGVMPNIYTAGVGIQRKYYTIDFALENVNELGLYALLGVQLHYGQK